MGASTGVLQSVSCSELFEGEHAEEHDQSIASLRLVGRCLCLVVFGLFGLLAAPISFVIPFFCSSVEAVLRTLGWAT